jgi:hypothetical protein
VNLALASLVLSKPYGFITDADLPAIIAADPLCWLLVRCGAQHGRFSAPAQNIAQLVATIEAAGDWVRDISFPSHVIEQARAFVDQPEKWRRLNAAADVKLAVGVAVVETLAG